ncbi:activator of Hsp90 ATPase, putative [Plasmodium knowlesi strain H]|uniref:Activator of Hsp90 ATPase, putative n=3 Tax=Plasmodium knowlesi TaxID=5850 RepID=A0A5K1U2P2_PLAKH|nr:activator of Hsp90 ATPase, putative [Plasmodium knowlesi strain H]OTN65794.1 putative Activator of Hsp90 ATPase-like protein 1-like protein [Plasmodium knowlesi]CAA9987982.1 activator of Hsp90 ATPase, putative [Plasmodium knowlesi strain H]SBO22102.1 activator of Hsp90 ATPase, putative [Plasmodium knowlesi strain H]SBO29161.1 activator of Hsp90 ATPase, putative [Plasmodium knowlesi strain H]VVS77456.1 activator of Hsp90 ATPase, putative [Plasmodium knowlesi strain H]|eukprot:XP_002258961.1 Activator of Hsp90 ATPase homolog 1-like protein, putative [Plasmodium knowlesi strain H]
MSFTIEEEYYVPPEVLFNAFTDAYTLTRLSRGSPAQTDAKVGGSFSLFAGSVYGEFMEIEKPHKIIQKWKFRDWCDKDYSKVTLEFRKVKENHTLLKLTQENIPTKNKFDEGGVLERCRNGWTENLLHNIEVILGYPKKK